MNAADKFLIDWVEWYRTPRLIALKHFPTLSQASVVDHYTENIVSRPQYLCSQSPFLFFGGADAHK